MANILKVNTGAMEDLVTQFKSQAENYKSAIAETDAAVKELGTWWQGDAYNQFSEHWERAVAAGNQQVETLESTAMAIQNAAQTYETTEASVTAAM